MSLMNEVLFTVQKQEVEHGFTSPPISPSMIAEILEKPEKEVAEALYQLTTAEYLSYTSQAPTYRMTPAGSRYAIGTTL